MNENLQSNNNQTKTTFSTGAVRDIGIHKEDYVETISFRALQRYAKYMTSKQAVYGAGNWRKGIPIESYEKSLMRHLQKYFANKYEDANLEPEEDHLAAAMFNLQGLMHEQEKEKESRPITNSGGISNNTEPSRSGDIDSSGIFENNTTLPQSDKPFSKRGNRIRTLDKIKELYNQGLTIKEIADQIGISVRTVYRRLQVSGDKS